MADHNTLTTTALHEPKGIDSAGTSDAGKVLTPSASVANTGELRNLVESEVLSKVDYLTIKVDDIGTAKSHYMPVNFAGTITAIKSAVDAATTTTNTILTCKIEGTNITNGAITIPFSGSAAGDVAPATPTANNVFASGNYIEVASDGGTDASAVDAVLMFTVTRT